VTDVLDRLRRARENREQQARLLEGLEGRVKQRRDDVERSLADLSIGQRSQVVTRAVNGHRAELKRQSLDSRVAYLKTVGALRKELESARAHYQSPVQMLAREGLGSERRSRIMHQIEKSGAVELASERLDRRREPSDADVRRAAARYREWYGEDAFRVIGDHMMAASFAPDGRHTRFLKRVSAELLATAVTADDRTRAIEH
jgi:hypothetical protein